MSTRTMGVEEELHLLDPATRQSVSAVEAVLAGATPPPGAQVEHEIKRSMIETGTSVCTEADAVLHDLRELRSTLVASAEEQGLAVASCGVLPTGDWRTSELVDESRYSDMSELYRQIFDEQTVCGLHVHVGIEDRELAVQVLNRLGPWLPPLLALSASSPIHEGRDTGFASYRTMVFGRWATSDLPSALADLAEHDRLVEELVATGTILDDGQIYWPVRLSRQYPTIEFRVADAVPTAAEAVLQAVLCRAVVERLVADVTAGAQPRQPYGHPPGPSPRGELVRAATWQASRFGMEGDLLDLAGGTRLPAADALHALLEQLREELEGAGDWGIANDLLARVLRDGAPAQRMRAAGASAGAKGVTDLLVAETAGR